MSPRKPRTGGSTRNPASLQNLGERPENLVPGRGAWNPGASPALKSGWRTRRPARVLIDPIVTELTEALAADAPVRDPDTGDVPVYDRMAVEVAAIDVLIVRRLFAYLELHDWSDPGTGALRPEVEHLGKANQRLAGKLDKLGMTPTSRARLGLDLQRTFDLAAYWQQQDREADRG